MLNKFLPFWIYLHSLQASDIPLTYLKSATSGDVIEIKHELARDPNFLKSHIDHPPELIRLIQNEEDPELTEYIKIDPQEIILTTEVDNDDTVEFQFWRFDDQIFTSFHIFRIPKHVHNSSIPDWGVEFSFSSDFKYLIIMSIPCIQVFRTDSVEEVESINIDDFGLDYDYFEGVYELIGFVPNSHRIYIGGSSSIYLCDFLSNNRKARNDISFYSFFEYGEVFSNRALF